MSEKRFHQCRFCGHPSDEQGPVDPIAELARYAATVDDVSLDYPAAARVIALYLAEFANESLRYPEMIAECARRASAALTESRAALAAMTKERDAAVERIDFMLTQWSDFLTIIKQKAITPTMAHLVKRLIDAVSAFARSAALRAELERRDEEAVASLTKYVRHAQKCNVRTKWLRAGGEHVCTCGLSVALATLAARRNPQTEEGA